MLYSNFCSCASTSFSCAVSIFFCVCPSFSFWASPVTRGTPSSLDPQFSGHWSLDGWLWLVATAHWFQCNILTSGREILGCSLGSGRRAQCLDSAPSVMRPCGKPVASTYPTRCRISYCQCMWTTLFPRHIIDRRCSFRSTEVAPWWTRVREGIEVDMDAP